jgi:hypothetical protein
VPLRVGVGTLFDTTSSHHRRDIVDRFKELVSTLALVVVRSSAQHRLIQSTNLLHDRSSRRRGMDNKQGPSGSVCVSAPCLFVAYEGLGEH